MNTTHNPLRHVAMIGALLACAPALYAQVETAWSNAPGGVSVAVTSRGAVYTTRWDFAPGGDIWLARRGSGGRVAWEVRFDNTDATRHEVATWVSTDRQGNALVSGTIRSGFSNPVNAASVLMKFSPQGTLLWRRVYDSSFDGSSTRKTLVDAQGNAYVLGLGMSPPGRPKGSFRSAQHEGTPVSPAGLTTQVKKFSPSGTVRWTWIDAAGIGAPINFKWTPDQALLITTRSQTSIRNGHAKITRAGQPVWNLAGITSQSVGDAAGDAFGNSYLAHGDSAGGNTGVVEKRAPDGSALWSAPVALTAFRVEVGSDQFPVVSGFPSAGLGGAAFAKFDADGTQQWINLDADGPGQNLLLHSVMLMDADDNAYLSAGTLFQMAVCKVDRHGSSAWTHTVGSGSTAASMALSPGGGVLVVGNTTAKLRQTALAAP